ncbi:MAG TPA: ATP-binding protein, partial [Vicinamibacteria bacterium]
AAQDLTELVDDLLDLAKVEAGKIVVRPVGFDLALLFGALRGMLRPLLVGESVSLVFEEPEGLPLLYGDEAKVSQVLRNFLSNALKFTERGEIRVSAVRQGDGVAISVADTGIGIAPEDVARIFDEFAQVEHSVQKKVKGTGLGLALSRRLAEVLGGRITVESAPGRGSTFTLHVPLAYAAPPPLLPEPVVIEPGGRPVVVLEDDLANLHVYERLLRHSKFQLLPARSVRQAQAWLETGRVRAVVLDIQLLGEDAWRFLAALKERPETRTLPVLVVTNVDDERKALALGADAYSAQPVQAEWLLAALRRLTEAAPHSVLIVDDDPAWRYLLGGMASRLGFTVAEAADGLEGVQRAAAGPPAAMVLDLVMPGLSGLDVLHRLRADPATVHLPVVVATSKVLEEAERGELARLGGVLLPKARLSEPEASELLAEALRRAGSAAEAVGAPRGGP